MDGYVDFLLDADIDTISVSPYVALETITKVTESEAQSPEVVAEDD